jgi:quercetin dioxygenase-like cupin family protein
LPFGAIEPGELDWITRPHEPGEPARHVAELSERLGLRHDRANVWRYEPGAAGKRHRHDLQEETFVVLAGTLTMYLGEPPERTVIATGGVLHVAAGTALQTVNEPGPRRLRPRRAARRGRRCPRAGLAPTAERRRPRRCGAEVVVKAERMSSLP